ncbi:MAG: hypothetical protein FJ012_04840 [Chloroflexi bacterium]|nr:hypothetical protein [Chloroflexota bacterium]
MKILSAVARALGLLVGSGAIGFGSVLVYRGIHHHTAGSHTSLESKVVGALLVTGGMILLAFLVWYRSEK